MNSINYKNTIENIREELKKYLLKYNLKALIIGESGGIDSALCTVLARPVCVELGVELEGRSIAIESNKPDEIDRGNNVGKTFCTNFKAVDLTEKYQNFLGAVEENIEEDEFRLKLRRGNIKARLRMIYLYNLAQQLKGIVLSTDNYTEYLEGFWTLHGDVGDFGMIQELWKTEVYGMAQWLVDNELKEEAEKLALKACIDAVPTDGLGITNSDLDQLGIGTYSEVDYILQNHLKNKDYCDNPVIQRHFASGFKRENPYNLKREIIVKKNSTVLC